GAGAGGPPAGAPRHRARGRGRAGRRDPRPRRRAPAQDPAGALAASERPTRGARALLLRRALAQRDRAPALGADRYREEQDEPGHGHLANHPGRLRMTDHQELLEFASLLPLGTLGPEEGGLLEAHLSGGCAECEQALRAAAEVVDVLATTVPPLEPSPGLRGRPLEEAAAPAGLR